MKKKRLQKIEKHEYLKEIHGENLQFPFTEKSYPKFEITDTYSLNDTMLDWLYERLRFFQDEVSQYVNLDGDESKIIVDGECLTQRQCIDRMVEDIKEVNKVGEEAFDKFKKLYNAKRNGEITELEYNKRFSENENEEESRKNAAVEDLFKVLSKCFWYLWW